MSVLRVSGLEVAFQNRVVKGVSFEVPENGTVALVGESGSGKSVTALSILGLLPPNARVSGQILFGGKDLLKASKRELRAIRGAQISMIFQEPMSSLNPVFSVGFQIGEALRAHRGGYSRRRVVELLEEVGISDPARKIDSYPFQLSGGEQQRVMIAMALACEPKLLIADEPTSALDVTVQAQIVRLLRDLAGEIGMALLLISHDLGVIGQLADRVQVMYGGRIVEAGATKDVFRRRAHPYTQGLFAAVPTRAARKGRRLIAIPGAVPGPEQLPPGCPFYGRCPKGVERCLSDPPAVAIDARHHARCFFVEAAQ